MRTIIHSTEAVMASSSAPCFVARGNIRPAELIFCIFYSIIFWQLLYANYECFASSVSVPCVFGECAMSHIAFHSFDCITLFNLSDIFLTFLLFLHSDFETRPWCVHLHATDPLVTMHRVVRILLFVLCLFPVLLQLSSNWPLVENCSQLKAIQHALRCRKRETQQP